MPREAVIACVRCGYERPLGRSLSVYEQQHIENSACPACGAFTLACREAAEPTRLYLSRRRRARGLLMQDAQRNAVRP